jgi:hypothetical protein
MNVTNSLSIGAWAAAAALCAACGGSVVIGEPSSGTTGAGAGSAGTTGAGGTVGTGEGPGGSGDGGSANVCGGIAGILCPAGEYCAFPSQDCGGDDDSGFCMPISMTGCVDIYAPVCGCDHQVYGNACGANSAGVDVDVLGGCVPPSGMFGCGAAFCQVGSQYCELDTSDVATEPSVYDCKQLPPSCGDAPSCACLAGAPCGNLCMTTADGGGFEVVCPGG